MSEKVGTSTKDIFTEGKDIGAPHSAEMPDPKFESRIQRKQGGRGVGGEAADP